MVAEGFWIPRKDNGPVDRRVQMLEMDIAVTVTETSTAGGGIKVGISVFGAEIGGKDESERTNVSRLKFSIPLVFPKSKVDYEPNVVVAPL